MARQDRMVIGSKWWIRACLWVLTASIISILCFSHSSTAAVSLSSSSFLILNFKSKLLYILNFIPLQSFVCSLSLSWFFESLYEYNDERYIINDRIVLLKMYDSNKNKPVSTSYTRFSSTHHLPPRCCFADNICQLYQCT